MKKSLLCVVFVDLMGQLYVKGPKVGLDRTLLGTITQVFKGLWISILLVRRRYFVDLLLVCPPLAQGPLGSSVVNTLNFWD